MLYIIPFDKLRANGKLRASGIKQSFIGLVLLIFAIGSVWAATPATPKGLVVLQARPAPALKLVDMDGNLYDLSIAQGRWKFVHFWASWCGPCKREMPSIQRMLERMQGSSLEIVLVNTAESEDAVFSFLASVAPDLNSLLDSDGLATEQWQPRGLPSTYLVDPQGNIRYVAIGGRPWDKKEYIDFLSVLK